MFKRLSILFSLHGPRFLPNNSVLRRHVLFRLSEFRKREGLTLKFWAFSSSFSSQNQTDSPRYCLNGFQDQALSMRSP